MWPWGALPLRPPPHESVGTCRVAWDALPLLPQAISASYFFDEKGAAGAFFIGSVAGVSTRPVMALIPGLIRASGTSPSPENPHGACILPGAASITDGGTLMQRKTCSGAAYYKRLIRGLPPSACLPFQARGKAPDQSLAPSARVCLSKLGERCRIDRLQPARICFPLARRDRCGALTSLLRSHPGAAARAADLTAESARAGTPSGRPARAGP